MAVQVDWAAAHRQELARREERRARRSGNGQPTVAGRGRDDVVASAKILSRTKIRAELRRLQAANREERIGGAYKLRRSLQGQPGLERLCRAADRLTVNEPSRRLFDNDDVVETFAEVEEAEV